MKAPIVSRKHIVQFTEFVVTSTLVTTHSIAESLPIQSVDAADEVVEGSIIKAVYVEMWLLSNSTAVSSFVAILEKASGNQVNPGFSQMTTLDAYVNKKNVLYTTQGLIGDDDTNAVPILRQWIKIPKSKQRFGLQDELRFSIAGLGAADLRGCGLYIYKSYS